VNVRVTALAASVLASLAASAPAAPARYALVIGQNQGDPDEETLHYAERDARRVAEVLMSLGDVERRRLALVLAPDRATLLAEIDRLVKRIADEGGGGMLVVYYSGHADGRALHLGGTRIWLGELEDRVRTASADVKILIIDACRSGATTRVKGGKPAPPFTINATDELTGNGVAVITSASADEDAQESDQLEGSFFTHHLVTGLAGAADSSADLQVSLAEAYQYAYTETLRATSSAPVTQHPTYSFHLQGRKEVIMTRLDGARRSIGYLAIARAGEYLVFERSTRGAVIAELTLDHATRLALPAGPYQVRRRVDNGVYDGSAQIDAGRVSVLDVDGMHEVPRGTVVRKGLHASRHVAVAFEGALTARKLPVQFDLVRGIGVALASSLETSLLTFDLRGSVLRSGIFDNNPRKDRRSDLAFGLDVAARHSIDVGRFAVALGVRGGVDLIDQHVVHPAGYVDDLPLALQPRAGVTARISWAPRGRWLVFAEGAIQAYISTAEQTSDKASLGLLWSNELTLGVAISP
jgi:hypothetical protein